MLWTWKNYTVRTLISSVSLMRPRIGPSTASLALGAIVGVIDQDQYPIDVYIECIHRFPTCTVCETPSIALALAYRISEPDQVSWLLWPEKSHEITCGVGYVDGSCATSELLP